jgi:hypothetical protein
MEAALVIALDTAADNPLAVPPAPAFALSLNSRKPMKWELPIQAIATGKSPQMVDERSSARKKMIYFGLQKTS